MQHLSRHRKINVLHTKNADTTKRKTKIFLPQIVKQSNLQGNNHEFQCVGTAIYQIPIKINLIIFSPDAGVGKNTKILIVPILQGCICFTVCTITSWFWPHSKTSVSILAYRKVNSTPYNPRSTGSGSLRWKG